MSKQSIRHHQTKGVSMMSIKRTFLFLAAMIFLALMAIAALAQNTNPPAYDIETRPATTATDISRTMHWFNNGDSARFDIPLYPINQDSAKMYTNVIWRLPNTILRVDVTGTTPSVWVKIKAGWADRETAALTRTDSASVAAFVVIDSFLIQSAGIHLHEVADVNTAFPHLMFQITSADTLNGTNTKVKIRTLRTRD